MLYDVHLYHNIRYCFAEKHFAADDAFTAAFAAFFGDRLIMEMVVLRQTLFGLCESLCVCVDN